MNNFPDAFFNDESIPDEIAEILRSSVSTLQVTKGQVLLEKDEISRKSYFVMRGCLRSYALDEKGREHIFMFAPEGWVIGDFQSLKEGDRSQLIIDAVEDSEVQQFDHHIFEKAQAMVPDFRAKMSEKLVRRMGVLQKRIILLMSAPARARYEDFMETYPEIVQRVPQRMVASYLGITPEALSRIRNEMANKK